MGPSSRHLRCKLATSVRKGLVWARDSRARKEWATVTAKEGSFPYWLKQKDGSG